MEAKNHGEALLHSTEKIVAEHGSKVGQAERRVIEDALAGLRNPPREMIQGQLRRKQMS